MKKYVIFLAVAVFCLTLFTGCKKSTVNIGTETAAVSVTNQTAATQIPTEASLVQSSVLSSVSETEPVTEGTEAVAPTEEQTEPPTTEEATFSTEASSQLTEPETTVPVSDEIPDTEEEVLESNERAVLINGKKYEIHYISDILSEIRYISAADAATAIGGTYNGELSIICDHILFFEIENNIITVDDEMIEGAAPTMMDNGLLYIPVEDLMNALGYTGTSNDDGIVTSYKK